MKAGSRLSIAASCFSIYAFQELKAALKDIKELRFIFTSPTFTTEKTPKQQREFYIPRLDRERTLYGSEFEVKLRNELTQKAIARECAEWIREKACFKSNKTDEQMMGFICLDDYSYSPINGFTFYTFVPVNIAAFLSCMLRVHALGDGGRCNDYYTHSIFLVKGLYSTPGLFL